ncbi:MAG: hypothetical protein QNJ44_05165 [Rhodobacter sp.]|nr:hypothetical protein [Rhodobacter sp.]
MSGAAQSLAQSLGCSQLVGRELVTTGLEVAKTFCELRRAWDFELMLEAKRMASKQRWAKTEAFSKLDQKQKSQWNDKEQQANCINRTRRKFSYAAQKMFKRFEESEAAWQKFRLARHMVEELGTFSDQELLTAVFETAHEHRQLPQPEKVIEGRSLYEAMWRDSELLTDVGSIPQRH